MSDERLNLKKPLENLLSKRFKIFMRLLQLTTSIDQCLFSEAKISSDSRDIFLRY